jgi:hypothetical protein
MQAYSDPKRANDPTALPDVEVFYTDFHDAAFALPTDSTDDPAEFVGWYWQPCFPGCLPNGEPIGPFATKAEALADAQSTDTD